MKSMKEKLIWFCVHSTFYYQFLSVVSETSATALTQPQGGGGGGGSNGNLCISSLNRVSACQLLEGWFMLFWIYLQPLMVIFVMVWREGCPDSCKTSNGSASDYPLIIITSLFLHSWLFGEHLGELIDHNKMNDAGTASDQWLERAFEGAFHFAHVSRQEMEIAKTEKKKQRVQVWMGPVTTSERAAGQRRWWEFSCCFYDVVAPGNRSREVSEYETSVSLARERLMWMGRDSPD